jgi:hypothetical protein
MSPRCADGPVVDLQSAGLKDSNAWVIAGNLQMDFETQD